MDDRPLLCDVVFLLHIFNHNHFDHIHSTIEGIRAEEKIGLPDNRNIVVSCDHLKTLERLGAVTH